MVVRKRHYSDSSYIAERGRTYILVVGQAVHVDYVESLKTIIKHDLAGPASLAQLIVVDEVHR